MAATNPNDTVYNSKTLSKWFAIGALLLFFAVIWAVLEDFDRPWKQYQRQYQKLVAAIGERRLTEAQNAMDKGRLEQLQKELAVSEQQLAQITREIDAKIKDLTDDYYKKNQKYQTANGKLGAMLFQLETKIKKKDPAAVEMEQEFKREQARVASLKDMATQAENAKLKAMEDRKEIVARQKALSDEITAKTREVGRLEKVISQNEANLANLLRAAPVTDFVAPIVKVNQVVLPHLKDDYFFNKVPRVDRCMTCHAAADKPGFEDYPQPFTTHPNLNLYVGPDSPHSFEKVGCTTCHAGVPQSVDFTKSAHTPKDEQQAKEWEEKYGWYMDKHILTPMVPLPMVEGKCIQCHAKQVYLEGAPNFNAGMRLIERYGCYTCHKFTGHFEELAKEKKPGPQLNTLASKLSKEWVMKWLWDPKAYRPSTLMPAFWKTHNNSSTADLERGAVEVEAITEYLFARSKPYEPIRLASQIQGDVENGKKLFGAVGCLACHASADFPRPDIKDPKALGYKDPRVPMFGPEMNQMGSKVNQEWLVSWLIDPKHYWSGTAMPSMKLNEKEATDIAVYLLSKRAPEFDAMAMPVAKSEVRDSVILEEFLGSMTQAQAQTKLASMSLADKKMFLGEKLVNHYGCYSCHAIDGFEKAPNIGPELTYEGSKDLLKFSFENLDIHHTRHDWIYTKIRTPRIWDVGKERSFASKTRMPHFGVTHEQAVAMTAIVIGYENKKVADEAMFKVDGRQEQIIAGHRQIHKHNCIGCHAMEKPDVGRGGEVLAHYPDDITLGPPKLYTQGRKTQPDWLYGYLMNTDLMIRPWLEIRMPQFQMTEKQANTYTQYFAAYDKAQFPFVGDHYAPLSSSDTAQAAKLFEALGCLTCHGVVKPGGDVSQAAPHLDNVKHRLQGAWLVDWLRNPQAIMPGTRMPSLWPSSDDSDPKAPHVATPGYFGDDAEAQMEAMRNYLFEYGGEGEKPKARPRSAPTGSKAEQARR